MYSIRFYRGTSLERQQQANEDNCSAYLDLQFNYNKDGSLNYTSVAIASNATKFTKRWAKSVAFSLQEDFNTTLGGNEGVLIGGPHGTKEADLIYTEMPAILIQPLFATNPLHASWLTNKGIQLRVARIIANNIYTSFPNGGLFAFSTSPYLKINLDEMPFFNTSTSSHAKTILRQASVMVHSQVASSLANYNSKVFTSRP